MGIYEARAARLRHEMASAGLDLVVGYSNGNHSLLASDSVRYMSGFKPMGPHAAVLLPKDDEPILILTPEWDVARAQKRSPFKRVIGTDDFAADFARAVRENGLGAGMVGLIGRARLTGSMRDFVNGQFNTAPVPFDQGFDNAAQVRDELELALTAKATEIAERSYEHTLKIARPGMLEYELAAEIDHHMKSQGADDNFLLMSASQHNQALRPPGDRRLDVGDVILAEITPSVEGQFSQICRTAVLGEASTLQQRMHQLLVDTMFAGIRAGKAGVRVGDMAKAMNEVMIAAGYEKYSKPPYMRVRGHCLGIGSTRPGDIAIDNETTLVAGMTFVLHPNQYLPETGYMLVGEPVLVTDEGLRILSQRQPGLDSIPV